eukprot:344584-Hanusia_phi.AAC.2
MSQVISRCELLCELLLRPQAHAGGGETRRSSLRCGVIEHAQQSEGRGGRQETTSTGGSGDVRTWQTV